MEHRESLASVPLRALLVGGSWDELWPCATSLEARGRTVLSGPIEGSVPAGRLRNILADSRATVIVASTPRRSVLALRDVPGHSSPTFTPPVLQCLTQRQLAVGTVHCDGDDFIVAPCPPDELELRRDRCRPPPADQPPRPRVRNARVRRRFPARHLGRGPGAGRLGHQTGPGNARSRRRRGVRKQFPDQRKVLPAGQGRIGDGAGCPRPNGWRKRAP